MTDILALLMPLPRVVAAEARGLAVDGRVALALEGLSGEDAGLLAQLAALVFGETTGGTPVTARLTPGFIPAEAVTAAPALQAESYELTVNAAGFTLTAGTLAGLQRGLQTVKQLLESALDDGGDLPFCRIADWPRLAHRGIHYDFARELGYRHEHIKSVIARIAYFKMNTFHLYLEGLFAFPSAPEITPPEAMTPAQAQDLCAYARIFGITLVPQLATMGHMGMLLNGPYAELREEANSAYNLCPTHPGSRPFLAGLIKDIAEAFHPPFIHLGYDESHSGYCERCQQHGTPQQLLAEHLNWMNGEVKKYGARAMIYGDKFLSPHDFPLSDAVNGGTPEEAHEAIGQVSRDIIITDWHYTAPHGTTAGYLVSQGFEVHLASATNIYWHDSIPYHRGHHWIAETIDNAVAQGITGAFNCNWEFYRGAFYENYWFFEGLAAERQWTDRPHDFLAFSGRFAQRFWGVTRDYYGEIAGLLEATPTQRRALFLDSSIFADGGTVQMKLDYVGIADYLDGLLAEFRAAARRNAESLRMLDMLTLIVRYLGTRMCNLGIARQAFARGDKDAAVAALRGIITVAERVGAKLAEGYQYYGGAVVDRERTAKHIDEVERFIASGDPREWVTLRNYAASPLLPLPDDGICDAALPGAEVKFRGLMDVAITEMADVRPVHCGDDGLIYLRTRVSLPHPFTGTLLYGSDGPVKVWVNGTEVDCRPDATNPCTADEYTAVVNWQAGDNEVLFALDTNAGRAWGVCARTGGKG